MSSHKVTAINKKTLYIDQSLIEFAHSYSQQTGQSISHLVEKYLQRLKDDMHPEELCKETQGLHGILRGEKLPEKNVLKTALINALVPKFYFGTHCPRNCVSRV